MPSKVLVIDPATRTVEARSIERPYPSIRSILSASVAFTRRLVNGDRLYVDDEAPSKPTEYFFRIDGVTGPLGGVGVLTGPSYDSVTLDVATTRAELLAAITWMTRAQFDAWAAAHPRDPAYPVNYRGTDGRMVTDALSTYGELAASMPRPRF